MECAPQAFQDQAQRGVQVVHSARRDLTETEVALLVAKGLQLAEVRRAPLLPGVRGPAGG